MSSGEYDCQFVFVTNEAAVLNDSPSGTAGSPSEYGSTACARWITYTKNTPTTENASTPRR